MSAPRTPLTLEILKRACARTGDRFELFDETSAFLAKVTRADKAFYAGAALNPAYPLNTHFSTELARDKAYMADVLRRAGIATVEGGVFFTSEVNAARHDPERSPAAALAYARAQGYPVFAKLNRSSHGRLARIVAAEDGLIAYLREARDHDHLIHVQPVIDLPEARVFVVDGEARFLYRREKWRLIGDGRRSIAALLGDFIADPRLQDAPAALTAVGEAIEQLSLGERALGDVPADGEPLFAADASNLAQGGTLRDLDLSPGPAVDAWSAKLAEASGLKIFGADVFFERLDDPASYQVIEINANPSLTGLWRAGEEEACLQIWSDVLDLYFARA
ncbi:MAG: hypothetical protein PVI23_13600 [Maricaulaceae bacterium]|jgi:glutathione synthase/RimK-type ligase-like ATP-grasp enzyme